MSSSQPNKKQPQQQQQAAKATKEKKENPVKNQPNAKTEEVQKKPAGVEAAAVTSGGDQAQKSKADLRRERALIQEAQRAKKAAEGWNFKFHL
jgi:hypothetical protein